MDQSPPPDPSAQPPSTPPDQPTGWAQPQAQAPAGPAWGQPPAQQPPAGPAWGQPAPAAPPAQAPGPAWGQPPPQQAPAGWAQPAPAASGWVQPSAQARGPVTLVARLGGLVLALIGILWGLIGAAFIAGGAFFKSVVDVNQLPGIGDALGNALAVLGIILLVIAIVELLAGIGAMLGKDWARVVGLLYALVFGAFSILIVVGGGQSDAATDATAGILFFVAHAVAYVYVLVIFVARWRGRATA